MIRVQSFEEGLFEKCSDCDNRAYNKVVIGPVSTVLCHECLDYLKHKIEEPEKLPYDFD
ncbi:hypothetical protein [Bacillus toyonensis]|uniref:hypothetical protein n=1 Tax=Bacillus toyonensis TaxID=155322 RepID=UPI002E251B22|nr:hypothetical protein [Bacillus toyonensis]